METTVPEDDDDYEVGYGKPPKHTRFPKGQSGNPLGRPKKRKKNSELLDELLGAKIQASGKLITKREAVFLSLVNDAIKGKASARNTLFSLLQDEEVELEDFDPSTDDKIEFLKTSRRVSRRIEEEGKDEA